MPKIFDRLVGQLKRQGLSKEAAHATATSQLQKAGVLKKGSRKLTKKGEKRNKMTAAQRAKDRAARQAKSSPKKYKYNPRTNKATLRKK